MKFTRKINQEQRFIAEIVSDCCCDRCARDLVAAEDEFHLALEGAFAAWVATTTFILSTSPEQREAVYARLGAV